MDRSDIISYLKQKLGDGKYTRQGIKFCCPKGCDVSQSKFNLEVNLDKNSSKYLMFHAWCCHYKGHLRFLLNEYSIDNSWMNHKELWNNRVNDLNKHETKLEKELPRTIPYYLSDKVSFYLNETRKLHDIILQERGVLYCYSENDSFYNNIIFPFYEDNRFIGFSTHNLKTKKYSNQRDLNFVPYKDFININYPIIITEGIYDSFSVPNAIPMLGTKPSEALLRFSKDKKIIISLDNQIPIEEKKEIANKFNLYGASAIVIFDLQTYKDLNEYRVNDKEGLKEELKTIFELLIQ